MRTAPLLLISVLALAACGGSSGPHIDRDVATKLAAQADAVASAADPCAARDHARTLQRQTIAATNAGRIPPQLQERLLGRVNELVDELQLGCLPVPTQAATQPPPPTTTTWVPPGHRKDHHGRGQGHGHDGDEG